MNIKHTHRMAFVLLALVTTGIVGCKYRHFKVVMSFDDKGGVVREIDISLREGEGDGLLDQHRLAQLEGQADGLGVLPLRRRHEDGVHLGVPDDGAVVGGVEGGLGLLGEGRRAGGVDVRYGEEAHPGRARRVVGPQRADAARADDADPDSLLADGHAILQMRGTQNPSSGPPEAQDEGAPLARAGGNLL